VAHLASLIQEGQALTERLAHKFGLAAREGRQTAAAAAVYVLVQLLLVHAVLHCLAEANR
jgi:hypothetical protein